MTSDEQIIHCWLVPVAESLQLWDYSSILFILCLWKKQLFSCMII